MSNIEEIMSDDAYDQRARMLQKLEIVWHSNPHLSFLQLVGFVSQGGSPIYNSRDKKPWVEQQNDACEKRIDVALKNSGDEERDIYEHYRPGKAPPAQPLSIPVGQVMVDYLRGLEARRGNYPGPLDGFDGWAPVQFPNPAPHAAAPQVPPPQPIPAYDPFGLGHQVHRLTPTIEVIEVGPDGRFRIVNR